jgi:uncharacterized protein (TIGR03067 family)
MILTAGLLVAADTPEIELRKFQGDWSLVMAVRDGREIPDDVVSRSTLVIKGDKFTFPDATTVGTGPSGTFKIDPTRSPKAIDVTPASGPDAGRTWLGIYEIDGDLYNVCLVPPGEARPVQFVSVPGSGAAHSVWRRGKSNTMAGASSDELQGAWDLESVTANGQKNEEAPFKGARYAVSPGRYTVTIGEQTLEVTYKLDRTTSPNAIDFTYQDEAGGGRMFRGIYRREGDTLMMCRPQSPEGERPKEFSAPADSGRVLMILKRRSP